MNTEYNPYSPPTGAIADYVDAQSLQVAGKGRRFGTLIIDYVGYYFIMFVIGIVIGIALGRPGVQTLGIGFWYFLAFAVLLGYYLFFEGIWQRTPGKFILGTVVVDLKGGKPSFGQILGRTFSRLIPFEAFSFFGQDGWHDSLPKTKVVMTRKG